MNTLDFVATTSGLEVSFRVLTKVPAKAIFDWDFGDDKGSAYNQRRPSYTYEKPGFYQVTLRVTDTNLDLTTVQMVVVNISSHTHLTDSIYNLINHYIPSELSSEMSHDEKSIYITKWQLYIRPLVNHCIPLDKVYDELEYEGLENQLIMELAAWDYLNVKITNLLSGTGEYLRNLTSMRDQNGDGSSDPEHARGDRIKQITTGPTEVQYYDQLADATSTLWSAYTKALQPGGVMDELRKNLCMLASRLEIFLPFCEQYNRVIVPKVVNRRNPGLLGGPNPTDPIKRGGRTIFKRK